MQSLLQRTAGRMAQGLVGLIYPPQCLTCDAPTETDFALCGGCWAQTPFISGLVCDACGVPLPGQDMGESDALCDECLTIARPWAHGRSAMIYTDHGRKIVLGLKHGDRTDLAGPAAQWMMRAGDPLVRPDMVVVPVPLHWSRLLQRKYNQAALLADKIARGFNLTFMPDALHRVRRGEKMERMTRDARFAALDGAITANPRVDLQGKPVLLIDDVMTSGATLAACTTALQRAGSGEICTLTLARASKDT